MNVFVLGGTGFLGYHAVLELLRRGHSVTVLALDLPKSDLLPKEVNYKLADIGACGDDEIREMLRGHDGMVFAIGQDDRTVPPAPAYEFFHKANVQSAERMFRLASEAGVKKGALCGSYFAYFDRIWPEMNIADHHPYVRARREQSEAAIHAGAGMSVAVLELPYIFGSMPGRVPLWAPLLRYIASPWPLFYTSGGTTMISVGHVAEAIVGAMENVERSGLFPVGDENHTWTQMLGMFGDILGKKKKVITLPAWSAAMTMHGVRWKFKRDGKEHGLDPVKFIELQSINTFIRDEDLRASREALGFGTGGLEQAFRDTITACR